MSEWGKVEYIDNIEITVDGGQSSSSIYGNERNCAALSVRFNGFVDRETSLNLRDVDVKSYVSLIDFDTSEPIPMEKLPNDKYGLYYSLSSGKFCNSPSSTQVSSGEARTEREKRAHVTYFVYGKFKVDARQNVAAKIILPNKQVTLTNEGSRLQKAEILIKVPVRYASSDLEPLEWDPVFRIDKGEPSYHFIKQTVAFVKLQRRFNSGWVDYEFVDFPKYGPDLALVSRTTGDWAVYKSSFLFLLCPLATKQNSYEIKLDDEVTKSVKLVCNQEAEALSIVRLTAYPESTIPGEDHLETGFFKLYDACGNLGVFKLDFEDHLHPTVISLNI